MKLLHKLERHAICTQRLLAGLSLSDLPLTKRSRLLLMQTQTSSRLWTT